MKNITNKYLPWLLLIGLAIIWGSSFIMIKKGLVGITPIQMASWRILVASLSLSPFAIIALKKNTTKNWGAIIATGFTGNLIPAFLFAYAQTNIASSLSAIINTLTPLFVIVIGIIFYSQKTHFKQMLGVVLGLIGSVVLIVFKSSSFELDLNLFAGLVIIAALFYGASANIIKYQLHNMNAIDASSLALLMVGPLAGTIFYFSGGIELLLNPNVYESLIYTALVGVVSTGIGLVMFNKLIQSSPVVFASSVAFLIPIVAIFWGWIDDEKFGSIQGIGMGIVFAALFLMKSKK